MRRGRIGYVVALPAGWAWVGGERAPRRVDGPDLPEGGGSNQRRCGTAQQCLALLRRCPRGAVATRFFGRGAGIVPVREWVK